MAVHFRMYATAGSDSSCAKIPQGREGKKKKQALWQAKKALATTINPKQAFPNIYNNKGFAESEAFWAGRSFSSNASFYRMSKLSPRRGYDWSKLESKWWAELDTGPRSPDPVFCTVLPCITTVLTMETSQPAVIQKPSVCGLLELQLSPLQKSWCAWWPYGGAAMGISRD